MTDYFLTGSSDFLKSSLVVWRLERVSGPSPTGVLVFYVRTQPLMSLAATWTEGAGCKLRLLRAVCRPRHGIATTSSKESYIAKITERRIAYWCQAGVTKPDPNLSFISKFLPEPGELH